MIDEVQGRVERIFNELIQTHLDLLLVLMAERDVPPEKQQARMDRLVRALGGAEVVADLKANGRPIPFNMDESTGKPVIKFNAGLLSRVGDEGIRSTFMLPVSELLGLPLTAVALVLQYDDEKQIKSIYHSAVRRLETRTIRATEIPAVVELRVTIFSRQVADMTKRLGRVPLIVLPPHGNFSEQLVGRAGGWPEWLDIKDDPFIKLVYTTVDNLLGPIDDLPTTETLLGAFWEGLDLSPPTFLKQLGRQLRTSREPIRDGLLTEIVEVIAPGRMEAIESLGTWPAFADVQTAWETLCDYEFKNLGRYMLAPRVVPTLSTLRPAQETFLLRQPESLPWTYPLVCWSVREVTALRDLLMGFVQAHRAEQSDDDPESLSIQASTRFEIPLDVRGDRTRIDMQVIGKDLEMAEGYDALMARAMRSAYQNLEESFGSLDAAEQKDVLQRLRAAYDGYFIDTKEVWSRRLQGWEQQPPEEAFKRLITSVQDILDAPLLFEPFKNPSNPQTRPVPTFVCIVGLSPHLERVMFKVPLTSLASTSATGSPPLIVRMIEVPDASHEPCRWLCDRRITMDTFQGQPVQLTLRAVADSSLRLLAYPAS